jgi:hypothetical protein
MASSLLRRPSRTRNECQHSDSEKEATPIAKKNPIVKVKFSYVGKASDFETFLKTIVRDYLSADDPAAVPKEDFVQKVESDCA